MLTALAGMNDVLPKPFTKEGLLTCLEKHLGHLKRGAVGSRDVDDSPIPSPAALSTNWNSPAQLQGPSPVGSHLSQEDYINAMRGQPPQQQYMPLDGSGPYQAPGPHTPLGAGPQPGRAIASGAHRRQVSEMSGGDDGSGQQKRHQMYPPMQMHGMQHR